MLSEGGRTQRSCANSPSVRLRARPFAFRARHDDLAIVEKNFCLDLSAWGVTWRCSDGQLDVPLGEFSLG